ncbi:DeoR/GlpR family DNA-binding transcription regulator [Fictibacillus terranigra]|uniref:DeoR/GlpR family DNA-binding transcription regulator n=1 Tax=Fictibacillus terranigra TaxID=3058424 RepID=A0ABT8E3D3_9BACL|nr:DeoR/GlpR family DNA-binding transcription regulator [Fictibacillus sp. CENA-BCM004]MDN4072419.1 DeoR/GlpR family DNA-binding transcription regulator [Fictibacillus sp. CENA-BCM004]
MYQDERMEAIVNYIKQHDRVDMETICRMNKVSRDTARRDLIKLEEEGKIVRTRGGAKFPILYHEVFNYDQRLKKDSEAKKQIGKFAAGLIQDGDHLLMDVSTTVQYLAENINTDRNVVVTNSIDIAGILSRKGNVSIHMLGGVLNNEHRSIYGARTIQHLSDMRVNKLFLGACGISSNGLTIPFEEEGFLLKEMIKRSDQVIVLADSTKFNRSYFQKVCGLEDIDILVTDQEIDRRLTALFEQSDVETIIL